MRPQHPNPGRSGRQSLRASGALCVQMCQPGALQLYRDAEIGIVSLRFEVALCDGCAACQRWCPEGAIQIDRVVGDDSPPEGFNRQDPTRYPSSGLPPSPCDLATSPMLACPRCGQLHAPAAMVNRVQSRVGTSNKALSQRLALCQACKVTKDPLSRKTPRGVERGAGIERR
jgi:ferredoxin